MGGRVSASERVALGAGLFTLALAVAAWGLMRLGLYSLARALGLALLAMVPLAVAARRSPAPLGGAGEWHPFAAALVLCVGFVALYAAYPTYFLNGGQDPGPYLAFAARIAKTGGLDLFVPEIQRWAAAHPDLARPSPAVYGNLTLPHEARSLLPQFVHLFPAFAANFFAVAGVEGAVRANAWLAGLCLLLGFVLLRRLGSLGGAFVFVVALGINPAFVWASRITLSEVLALLLNLGGLFLLLLAWDLESRALGVLGGAVLGAGVLDRLDGGVSALAVFGFAAASLADSKPRARSAAFATIGHLAVMTLGYWDGHRAAEGYWQSLDRAPHHDLSKLILLTYGLDALGLVLALLPARLKRALLTNETTLRLALYAALALVSTWVIYGHTLRPIDGDPETASSLPELTWYVSWVAWPLAIAGLAVALGFPHFGRWLPLWIYTAGSLFLFTALMEVTHEHIWASRRWVPQVIPFLLLLAAFGGARLIAALRTRPLKFGAAALAVTVYAVTALSFDRPFLLTSMLKGLPAGFEKIADFARRDPSHLPLLTNTPIVASILTYVYDVPTLRLNDAGQNAAADGRLAGFLGVGMNPFGLHHASALDARVFAPYLANTESVPPSELFDFEAPLEVGFFGAPEFDVSIPASHKSLRTRDTTLGENGALIANGNGGQVLWGPWLLMTPGRYRVEWYGSIGPGKRKRRGTLDVIHTRGNETIDEKRLLEDPAQPGERLLGGIDFTLTETLEDVEFRVRVDAHSNVTLTRVRLQRFGP